MELVSSWILTSHHSHTHTHTHTQSDTHTLHTHTHTRTHRVCSFELSSFRVLPLPFLVGSGSAEMLTRQAMRPCWLAPNHVPPSLPGSWSNPEYDMKDALTHTHTHTHTQVRIRLAPNHVPLSLPGSWSNPDYDNLTWKLHTHTHTHWG